MTDEFRKMKAIIVKHENRIRALEAVVKALTEKQEKSETDSNLDATLTKEISNDSTESSKVSTDEHPLLSPDEV